MIQFTTPNNLVAIPLKYRTRKIDLPDFHFKYTYLANFKKSNYTNSIYVCDILFLFFKATNLKDPRNQILHYYFNVRSYEGNHITVRVIFQMCFNSTKLQFLKTVHALRTTVYKLYHLLIHTYFLKKSGINFTVTSPHLLPPTTKREL